MDAALFLDWFETLFLPGTRRGVTQLLIVDNHSSRLSLDLIDCARKSNVIVLGLPSKTTHVLQPLDRSVFSSLATHHQKVSAAARLLKPDHRLILGEFVPIFTEAYNKAVTPVTNLASFKTTGIYPFNRNAIPADVLTPATLHASSIQLSDDTLALYQWRLKKGYDVPGTEYEQWKAPLSQASFEVHRAEKAYLQLLTIQPANPAVSHL